MTDYREQNEVREWKRFVEEMDIYEDQIPTHVIVCPVCNGKGTHVNPAIDSYGLTREDFNQDPDFEDDYRSGVYDVRCYTCEGRNVVDAVDWEKLDPEVRADWYEWKASSYELAAMYAAEQRAGC
jgi:hypothetical protein